MASMIKNPRVRDEKHLAFIRKLPCCVCKNDISTEAAHIRFSDARVDKVNAGVGQKPDDAWTLPLCSECHRKQHAQNERKFWHDAGIDAIFYAMALHRVTGDHARGCKIVMLAGPYLYANIMSAG